MQFIEIFQLQKLKISFYHRDSRQELNANVGGIFPILLVFLLDTSN